MRRWVNNGEYNNKPRVRRRCPSWGCPRPSRRAGCRLAQGERGDEHSSGRFVQHVGTTLTELTMFILKHDNFEITTGLLGRLCQTTSRRYSEPIPLSPQAHEPRLDHMHPFTGSKFASPRFLRPDRVATGAFRSNDTSTGQKAGTQPLLLEVEAQGIIPSPDLQQMAIAVTNPEPGFPNHRTHDDEQVLLPRLTAYEFRHVPSTRRRAAHHVNHWPSAVRGTGWFSEQGVCYPFYDMLFHRSRVNAVQV